MSYVLAKVFNTMFIFGNEIKNQIDIEDNEEALDALDYKLHMITRT